MSIHLIGEVSISGYGLKLFVIFVSFVDQLLLT